MLAADDATGLPQVLALTTEIRSNVPAGLRNIGNGKNVPGFSSLS
jgi:hypothetical protein